MILKESEILRKTVVLGWFSTMQVAIYTRGGGGGLPYETDGDARRKFWI